MRSSVLADALRGPRRPAEAGFSPEGLRASAFDGVFLPEALRERPAGTVLLREALRGRPAEPVVLPEALHGRLAEPVFLPEALRERANHKVVQARGTTLWANFAGSSTRDAKS